MSRLSTSFHGRRFVNTKRGFSLIEVVLALGVMSFAILSIMALLPMGLQTNRDSHEESVGTNLIAAMVADWRALKIGGTNNTSPVFNLPKLQPTMPLTNTIGIGETGQLTNLSSARYRVAYRIIPPATSDSFAPYYISFVISWPAQATNVMSSVESIAAIPSR